MFDPNVAPIEEVASEYLQAKAEAKAAKERVETLKKVMGRRAGSGPINVGGILYQWVVSVAPTTKYKGLLDWLHDRVQPDVQVLIEEGKGMAEHAGTRTTQDLKPVE